jgi:phosphatidyl-myo-inositol alpha-mannosyltransferase
MGHQVKIMAPCSNGVAGLSEQVIPLGRPIPWPNAGSVARMTFSLTLSPKVKQILRTENFDVVHIHEPLIPTLPLTVLRLAPPIRVGTFHAYHSKPRGYFWSKYLLKRWCIRLDGRIAVSPSAMRFVSRHFPGEYEIIPNGIDVDLFSPAVAPIERWCDGKLNILFVGRFEKRKGVRYLLDAYSEVKRRLPGTRLILVGPGTRLRKGYEKTVLEGNLEDVVFVGQAALHDLPRYYRTADVFCAPATGHESFGIVLLEAMATGKPIVASKIDGFADLVTHGAEGLLVPPRDSGALAEALLHVLENRVLQQEMGARGRMKAEQYSWNRVAQRVVEYYSSLLNGSVEADCSAGQGKEADGSRNCRENDRT